mmetsp:Transcript_3148/g.8740  ORF Transcript_3148/g.8740 Transcript_3148/m.8740 type:complete len:207 (+) Transcript_3148:592-1212(+)
MIARVSSITLGTSSFMPFNGSEMECSFSASASLPWRYSSSISSQCSSDTGPSMSPSSHAPISSAPYSSARNWSKSAALMPGSPRPSAPSSSPFGSPSSPTAASAPRFRMALKSARSGRSWFSAAVGPHSMVSSGSARPAGSMSSTSSSSSSSYSSACSSARRTSASSSLVAGCRFSSLLGTLAGASRMTPTTPPPLPPLTRFRCCS